MGHPGTVNTFPVTFRCIDTTDMAGVARPLGPVGQFPEEGAAPAKDIGGVGMAELVHAPMEYGDWLCRCGEPWPCEGWAAQQSDYDVVMRAICVAMWQERAPADVAKRVADILAV